MSKTRAESAQYRLIDENETRLFGLRRLDQRFLRCNTDFLLRRAQSELIELRNEIATSIRLEAKPNPYRGPFVCSTNPTSIDLNQLGNTTQKLTVAGYNFDKEQIDLVARNYNSSAANESDAIIVNNPYLLTIRIARSTQDVNPNVAAATVVLSDNSESLVLQLEDGRVLASIGITGQVVPGLVPSIEGRYVSQGGEDGGGYVYFIRQQDVNISVERFDNNSGRKLSSGSGTINGRRVQFRYDFIEWSEYERARIEEFGGFPFNHPTPSTSLALLDLQDNGDLSGTDDRMYVLGPPQSGPIVLGAPVTFPLYLARQ